MLLHLDRESRVPLHEQIRAQIALHIDQGTVRPGSKLPPTRVLARSLGVNRSTVYRCYQELWAPHVRRVHRAYRPRMRALLDGLDQHLPKSGVTWSKPQGGYTLLVQLRGRRKTTEAEAMERLRAAGVLVSPGSLFFPTPPESFCFRLSLSNVPPAKIAEGCRRLGKAMTELV
jgi:DNA-binding transcriptional MocR family regulator